MISIEIEVEDFSLLMLAIKEAKHAYTFTAPRLPAILNDNVHKQLSEASNEMSRLEARMTSAYKEATEGIKK
jgi:hypothetical protein